MPITEDKVKKAMEKWLERRGFKNVKSCPGTRKGPDVEGVSATSDKRKVIECKGETDATNQWDRAWRNVSNAIFNVIKKTENPQNLDRVALAFPDTKNYRERMKGLAGFCRRQKIAVYWVTKRWAGSTMVALCMPNILVERPPVPSGHFGWVRGSAAHLKRYATGCATRRRRRWMT